MQAAQDKFNRVVSDLAGSVKEQFSIIIPNTVPGVRARIIRAHLAEVCHDTTAMKRCWETYPELREAYQEVIVRKLLAAAGRGAG
jgi:hypothetical protein